MLELFSTIRPTQELNNYNLKYYNYPESGNPFMSTFIKSNYFKVIIMAVIYYLSGKISFSIFQQDFIITVTAFAPEGFALAAALIYGRAILPGIFLGQLILALDSQIPFAASLGISAVNAAEAYIAIRLFDHFNLDRHLKTLRDVVGLLAMILLVLQPFSAILSNIILHFLGNLSSDSLWQNLFFWWFGNIMGQLLFAPMLLVLYYDRHTHKYYNFILIILVFIIFNYLLQVTLNVDNVSVLLIVTLPVTIYLSTISLSYASVASVVLASISLYLTHLHLGSFTGGASQIDNIIDLNFFMLSHIILVLLIGTLFREKEDAIRILKAMAHYDHLTGLPNRHLLREEIHHTVYLAHENGEKSAVCFIDLDGFKAINDTLGHHIGDTLLKEIADRLRSFTRSEDALLRIGGDEFLLIFNRITSPNELDRRLSEMLTDIASITNLEGYNINTSLSVGVAWCPASGTTVESLMNAADNAMYQAKKAGRNRYVYA
jgi:diguanylate cyclase (GGDEF)-like protein